MGKPPKRSIQQCLYQSIEGVKVVIPNTRIQVVGYTMLSTQVQIIDRRSEKGRATADNRHVEAQEVVPA